MASIRHRVRADGSVAWNVMYRDNGVQRSITYETERGASQAVRLFNDLGVDAALAVIEARISGDGRTPTLREWAEEYIDGKSGITDGTRVRYRGIVAKGLDPLADLPIDAITPAAIAKWVNARSAEGLSSKTISNRHGFLFACLEQACESGVIQANPCKRTKLPSTEHREMVFLTVAELGLLLSYIRPDARGLVLTLAGTGLRWGEATALQVRDWDAQHARLTVSRSWKFTGSSARQSGAPKTARSRRTVAVPPEVAAEINARVAGKAAGDLVFTNSRGEAWRASAFHSSVWQPAIDYANGVDYEARRRKWLGKDEPARGYTRRPWRTPAPEGARLGKRPRIHDLRHTCASWLIQGGVLLPVVQAHLGHESIKTTVDRYGHLEPAHLAAVSGTLSAGLSGLAQIGSRPTN